MASKFAFTLLIIFFISQIYLCFVPKTAGALLAQAPPTNALVLPVLKDGTTSLHIVNILKGTPLKSIPYVVDLNGKFLSFSCEQGYSSSTYNAPICQSTQCSLFGTHFCKKCSSFLTKSGCRNNTCAVIATNPLTRQNVVGEIAQDVVAFQTLENGSNNPRSLAVLRHLMFACVPSSFFQGPLPNNVQGLAGFNQDQTSLPRQLSSKFGLHPKFALCLSSENNETGVIFFGNASYRIASRNDFSQALQYTPLSIGSRGEYFVTIKSIMINHKPVQFNTALLSRTMISTINPYTTLEHSIFQSVTQVFAKEFSAIGASQTNAVSPFGACFNKLPRHVTKDGILGAPIIDFVMQNENVTWSINGSNSLFQARPGIWCLAFVDGGFNPRASIVLGAFQLEDHIVEFDLSRSLLGFTQTVLSKDDSKCSQFNFNSTI
ncbi:OLC1v1033893C1 [Oldenlandia corymbosa var. corymbosa]|uniref:OLC1v1033893C1 n=1 Tax=Oldenlandia corymbosa var. corymbosa TaxID=529605 RepID=A0AAV1CQ10_OLDCO|nr:OLC1v1033893C1 [Oldenlandia corymbosa var. corymbosa]